MVQADTLKNGWLFVEEESVVSIEADGSDTHLLFVHHNGFAVRKHNACAQCVECWVFRRPEFWRGNCAGGGHGLRRTLCENGGRFENGDRTLPVKKGGLHSDFGIIIC